MTSERWQDLFGFLTGLWLFLSPWLMDYTPLNHAAWSAYSVGAALVVFEAVALVQPAIWEELVDVALGMWLLVSPFVLGFMAETAVAMNAMIVGVTVIALAFWGLLEDAAVRNWWHDHRFH